MKKAIIIHGMPSKEEYFGPAGTDQSRKHWLGWLQDECIKAGIDTVAPEMPRPYEPVYETWCATFEKFSVDENTILIGHSIGAGFLVRWLSENQRQVGKVVLVAPWLDPKHELHNGFFDFEIDKGLVTRVESVTIFVSSDDDEEILESVKKIKNDLPGIITKEFSNQGHFTFGDMGTHVFPELLEILL
ncbi:MAG: alpha/beta hydrolase [Candidatus Moranbacteria bacterium]|nr:alpha/beta hydrolase [Candidatus Moranbacteria bacterium]